jgi:uncharacterized protein YecE (DUF72 family)
MRRATDGVLVGTSGWVYADWANRFYAGVPRSRWLEHYAATFPTVEVNNTFYRLPTVTAVEGWRARVPDTFRFVVKGSRFLTHMRRLLDTTDGLARFVERVEPLGDCLDTILWQLPPTMKIDLPRLDTFLAALPGRWHHAVEFRHASWLTDETYRLLDRHRVRTVAVSGPQLPEKPVVTGGAAYVRFHGLRAGYAYDYKNADLAPWAKWLQRQRNGLAFFNNDVGGHAIGNALQLTKMLAA